MSAEVSIVLLVLIVLTFCYGIINPRFSGSDFNKIAMQDLLSSLVVFGVVGSTYYGSGKIFTVFGFEMDWFLFTLVVYALIESLCFIWYKKRYGIEFPR